MMWTAKQDKDLRKYVKAGMSGGAIAEALGVSRNAVCGRKFRLGICDPKLNTKSPEALYSQDDLASLHALWFNGFSYKKIASRLRRSPVAIAEKIKKLRRAGVNLPYRVQA